MVAPLLLIFGAVVQQQLPRAQADVDRTLVEVGDDIVLTIQLDAYGTQSVEVVGQPPLTGLQFRGSNQSSNLSLRSGSGVRTTVWEYTLRAVSPGRAVIGPIRVRAGVEEIVIDALSLEVRPVDAANREAVDARIARIVQTARVPDGSDEVRVSVVPWPDSIVLGEQVDLVVVAWFPRETRTRLRTRPTLTPPELQGAWSYAQTSALGVVATREFSGRLYDLFVHHQVVFPLTAGRLDVGPARVSFSIPLRQSILSREQPREVESPPAFVVVMDQPATGRPSAFDGAAAAELSLDVVVDSGGFAAGEVASVIATLRGRGNVALWPEPQINWPAGLRVYPGTSTMEVNTEAGFVVGSKTFNYLVAADSIGSFTIPAPALPYYDSDDKRFRVTSTQPITLVSRVPRDEEARHIKEIPLLAPMGQPLLNRLTRDVPDWLWGLLVAVPPVILLTTVMASRLSIKRGRGRRQSTIVSDLEGATEQFRYALNSLVRDAESFNREQLCAALEAAGVDVPLAAQTARVRDRLRQAVYGPPYGLDAEELRAEVTEVLRALPGRVDRAQGFVTASMVLFALLTSSVFAASAQAPSAEQLYDAGGFEQAADSFALRAQASSDEPAHWANLGAALYSSGRLARARAAWVHAARQIPRNRTVSTALKELNRLDATSAQLAFVSPVTASEAFFVAGGFWILAWLAIMLKWRRAGLGLLVGAFVCAGFGAYVSARYQESVGFVVSPNTPLRSAPYGPAVPLRLLSEDTAVRIVQSEGVWVFVRRSEARGWLLESEIARI